MNIIQILDGGRLSPSYSNVIDFPSIEAQNSYWDKKKITKYEYKTPIQIYEEYPLPLSLNYSMDTAKNFNYLRIKVDNGKDEFGMTQYKWYYYFITKVDYNSPTSVLVHIQLDVWQTYMFDYEILDSFVVREHQDRYDKNGNAILNRKDEGLDLGTQLDISEPTYLGDNILWFHIITTRALAVKKKEGLNDRVNKEIDVRASVAGLAQPFFHYILPLDPTDPDKPFFIQDGDSYTYRMIEPANILTQALSTTTITQTIRVLPYPPVPYELVDGQYIKFADDSILVHIPNDNKVSIADHAGDPDGENDKLHLITYKRVGLGSVMGPAFAEEGETVAINFKYDEEHTLERWELLNQVGTPVETTIEGNSFVMPSFAVFVKAYFKGGVEPGEKEGKITRTVSPISEKDSVDVIVNGISLSDDTFVKAKPGSTVQFDIENLGTGTWTTPDVNLSGGGKITLIAWPGYPTAEEKYYKFIMPKENDVNIVINYSQGTLRPINYSYKDDFSKNAVVIDKFNGIEGTWQTVNVALKPEYQGTHDIIIEAGHLVEIKDEIETETGKQFKVFISETGAAIKITVKQKATAHHFVFNYDPINLELSYNGKVVIPQEFTQLAVEGQTYTFKAKDLNGYRHETRSNFATVVEEPYGTINITVLNHDADINIKSSKDTNEYTLTASSNSETVHFDGTNYKARVGEKIRLAIRKQDSRYKFEVVEAVNCTYTLDNFGIDAYITEPKDASITIIGGDVIPVSWSGQDLLQVVPENLPNKIYSYTPYTFTWQDKSGQTTEIHDRNGRDDFIKNSKNSAIINFKENLSGDSMDLVWQLSAAEAKEITWIGNENVILDRPNSWPKSAIPGNVVEFSIKPKGDDTIDWVKVNGISRLPYSTVGRVKNYRFTMPNEHTTVEIKTTSGGSKPEPTKKYHSIKLRNFDTASGSVIGRTGVIGTFTNNDAKFEENHNFTIEVRPNINYQIVSVKASSASGRSLQVQDLNSGNLPTQDHQYRIVSNTLAESVNLTVEIIPTAEKFDYHMTINTNAFKFDKYVRNGYIRIMKNGENNYYWNGDTIGYNKGDILTVSLVAGYNRASKPGQIEAGYSEDYEIDFGTHGLYDGAQNITERSITENPTYVDWPSFGHRVELHYFFKMPAADTTFKGYFKKQAR